ncbi:hypothetical protein Syun_000641 [Stephania yunnanensis]|uniref:Uncharacterized protein n=1 Tax=Stephania yunnanensis TaxID=152371 RepID=A0AAP0LCH3_9MAGN
MLQLEELEMEMEMEMEMELDLLSLFLLLMSPSSFCGGLPGDADTHSSDRLGISFTPMPPRDVPTDDSETDDDLDD